MTTSMNRHLAQLEVSPVGLGCMRPAHSYGPVLEADFRRVVHEALDAGVTHFDTGDVHGEPINEEMVRRSLAGRSGFTVATKVGSYFGEGGDPQQVVESCERSLVRLGVETIDLLYLFRVDAVVPLEETWGAMSELVHSGKVRYLGISEASADSIRRAHAVHPVSAVQSEYSLWTRGPEQDGVLETTVQLGIGFVASSALGRRFLTGTVRGIDDLTADDSRRNNPRFQGANLEQNLRSVETLRSLADGQGMSMAQLALAWLLNRSERVVPLFSTVSTDHLAENLEAVGLRLSDTQMSEIDAAVPAGWAAGDRYSNMNFVGK